MKNTSKDLPWKNEQEFHALHAKDIFSKFPFYHVSMMGNTKEEFVQYIVKKANIQSNSKVVDLGCGSGYLVHALSKICECRGISNSSDCIEQARINYPDARFELGNMETYTAPDTTHFLALESLGYSDMNATFNNISQQLKKGGLFYIKDLCRKTEENAVEKANRMYWEYYWKYEGNSMLEVEDAALKAGLTLLEYNDLTGKTNDKMFLESLAYNQAAFKLPFPAYNFLEAAEFVFIK